MTEVTEKFHLPLYSGLSTNAYYLADCKVVEHRPSYAACLSKVRDHEAKSAGASSTASCRTAMRNGTCNALHMKQEEELAGKALTSLIGTT